MKNSPGSMIGGIGFTTCVREVHMSRITPRTSSTSSSSTPRKIVAFERFRNPPELDTRVARNSLSRSASTRAPASSLCTIATTSFIGRSIRAPPSPVNAFRRTRAVYDAASRTNACRSRPVSIDGPSTDPRRELPAAIRAATSDDLQSALDGILAAAVAGSGADGGAILLADPDRADPQLAASTGFRDGEVEALGKTTDIAGVTAAPLVIGRGGVEATVGTLILRWPDGATAGDPAVIDAFASLAALAADRARHASNAIERSEWFERMAATDPLTGIANERTVARVLELELARAGRQGGEVSLALFDVDDFRAANANDIRAADDILRRVASVLSESVRFVDTVGRIGGDEFVLVAPGAAGVLVAKRVQDGIAALPGVAGRGVSVSAGVATFPRDAGDAEALIEAAKAALDRAKSTGAGSVADAVPVPGTPS